MNPRTRFAAILGSGLVAGIIAIAVLYGNSSNDVQLVPPPQLDKFELTAGRPAVPDLAFEDGAGMPTSIAKFKGRVLLLNLWATWCAPCVAELPDLARTQSALSQEKFLVLPVDMEKLESAKVAAFLKEHDSEILPVYIDRNMAVMRGFEAFALPFTVLIDAEGREIGRASGPQDWGHPDVLAYLRGLARQPTP